MEHFQISDFPELYSDRLFFRQLKHEDYEEVFVLRSDSSLNRFTDIKKVVNKTETLEYIDNMNRGFSDKRWLLWGITKRENPMNILGTICLWNFSDNSFEAEVGYVLLERFQMQGIMKEAILVIEKFAVNVLKLEKINADVHSENIPSIKLLFASGYKKLNSSSTTNNHLRFIKEFSY